MARLPWELTDEQRWAEAESILGRHPTPAATQRLRQQQRRIWLLLGGVIVVVTAGMLLILLLTHSHLRPHQVPRQQEILGVAFQLLGVVLTFTGVARQVRSDNWRERSSLPMTALTWRQRRELLHQMRGRRPVEPARLALLHDLATRQAHPRGQIVMSFGLTLTVVGRAVGHPDALHVDISGAYLVLLTVVMVSLVRRQGYARRFLETYGEGR